MSTLPNRFNGDMFFEEILRRFFSFKFKDIRTSGNDFIDNLFGRYGDDTRLQIKQWFNLNQNITVDINFPKTDQKMPFVAIVSASEEESDALLGDYGGEIVLGAGSVMHADNGGEPSRAPQIRQLITIPERRVTRIFVATNDANATNYLYTIVKSILLLNKADLESQVGIQSMVLSGQDLEWKQELFPQFGFFKLLSLTYMTYFDVSMEPTNTIGGVNVSIINFLEQQNG